MAKIGIFKKVAALATAIAIVVCFAASTGAVTVSTTTTYLDDSIRDEILVSVTVSDVADKRVSYYAYNAQGPVYIDQFDDGNATVNFDYVTDTADLYSDVKVGYTGASVAEEAHIDARTVTWNGVTKYIPTEATEAAVTFATDATAVTSCTADNAEVTYDLAAGESITIFLSEISGPVTLTIETKTEATVQLIDAAYVYSDGHDDIVSGVDTNPGDKKLTVIGKAKGASEYGIIVSETNIDPKTATEDEKYQAIANNDEMPGQTANGFYAVQVIDYVGDGDEFLADALYVGAYADGEATKLQLLEIRNLN